MSSDNSTYQVLRIKWLVAGFFLAIACGLALVEWHMLFSPLEDAYATQEKILRVQQQLAMSAERVVTIEGCSPELDHKCMGIDHEKLRGAADNGEIKVPALDAQ